MRSKKFTYGSDIRIFIVVGLVLFIAFILNNHFFSSNAIELFVLHPTPTPIKLAYTGLRVIQNHFVDESGNITVLKGASRWSLEYSCGDGHFTPDDFHAMKSWGMNTVRIPFNENYFLNPTLCDNTYQKTLDTAITNATSAGLYVILDLHWIQPKEVPAIDERGGQFPMPDNQTIFLWQQLAHQYKNNPHVLFELMNEPHDISCDIWKNGGTVISTGHTDWISQTDGQYETPGFQKLVTVVRDTGADNIIIQDVSGEADLTCAITDLISDSRQNIAYSAHFYDTSPQGEWEASTRALTNKFPVVAGEYDSQQVDSVLPIFSHDLKTGYLFWVWDTGDIIKDYSGTPTNATWQHVKDVMLSTP